MLECKVFITNVNPKVTEKDLHEHFIQYGKLLHSYLIIHPVTKVSRNFGYVHFAKKECAKLALKMESQNPNKKFKCEQYSVDGGQSWKSKTK